MCVALSMNTLLVSIILKQLSRKVHFMICKIGYNVSMAAPGHVAEDKEGHVSEDSTGCAALKGLLCCLQQHGLELPSKQCILYDYYKMHF